MSILKLSLLAAALFAGNVAVYAQTGDEIMAAHEKAVGGTENWSKIKTIKLTGSASQQGRDIAITQTVEVGKAMRTDISVMGMNGFQIVTNTDGWSYMPFMGAAKIDTLKPDQVKAAQPQLDVTRMYQIGGKERGVKAEYIGKDTIANAPCFKVKLTDKEGNESTTYFDCATYYTTRIERKVKMEDQEVEDAVIYANYKKMDEGVVMPMSVTAQGAELTFKTVEINKPIPENTFKPIVEKK